MKATLIACGVFLQAGAAVTLSDGKYAAAAIMLVAGTLDLTAALAIHLRALVEGRRV